MSCLFWDEREDYFILFNNYIKIQCFIFVKRVFGFIEVISMCKLRFPHNIKWYKTMIILSYAITAHM